MVAESVPAQGLPALFRCLGKELRPAVQAVQVLAYESGVEQHGALIRDQGGDLAERVDAHQLAVGLRHGDYGAHRLDAVGEAGLVREYHYLAHVRRARDIIFIMFFVVVGPSFSLNLGAAFP